MCRESPTTVDDYKKLNNQPLQFALAEFRFSPVMQIADYIPEIQEELRKQYPILNKTIEQTLENQTTGIAVLSKDRWAFISANKRNEVDLNQERLVYITTDYSGFEGFSSACQQALEVLENIVEPGLILRIGMRYGDLVVVDEGEQLSDLVNEHFGYPHCIGDSLGSAEQQITETNLKTKAGRLLIRTLYGQHKFRCLADIQQALPMPIKVDEEASERIILDFDHFWRPAEESVGFETTEVLKILESLHETTRAAFWKITTKHARDEKWT